MNRIDFEDKVRGTIFGQAFGDALGLGTEFLNKKQIKTSYPNGLSHVNQIIRDGHRSRWEIGDWTDDTDQMLCILDSILSLHQVDIHDIASRIYDWAYNGEMGIGKTVASVIYTEGFCSIPHQVSEKIWIQSGRRLAANGAIMRTSILGIWEYQSLEKVKKNAENVCKITHYDPRCIASCQIICTLIANLLQDNDNIAEIVGSFEKCYKVHDERVYDYLQKAKKSISDLELDDSNSIGYTLKPMASAIWSLFNAESYEEGILKVIHEGGDADSNASVVGAIMGCKYGFSGIPKSWIDSLIYREELEERVQKLLTILN